MKISRNTRGFVTCILLFLLISGSSITSNPIYGQISTNQIIWPEIYLQSYAGGLDHPVHITNAKDGSYRLFVVEQMGRIRIIQNNQLFTTPFLDISSRVRSPDTGGGSEEGLLSVAFPNNYGQKNHFYVYYTNLDGDNVVSRFSITGDPNIADPDSEYPVLYLFHPGHTNHNGGQLVFGPDDYLYIGTGDGGGSGDPDENAQDPGSLLGKILRIDIQDPTEPYTIPATNPYTQTTGTRGEIWALGLRNPWRFSFDRENSDLFIGDVGQNRIEEIDFQPAFSIGGENYGWDILEGSSCYEPPNDCIPPERNVFPIAEYEHGQNNSLGCSVTGGYIYRGDFYPRMYGVYFYADFCTGKIWGLQPDQETWINALLFDDDQPYAFSTFGEDEHGNLYIADRTSGDIYRLSDTIVRYNNYIPMISR
jgi:glucose/arabinose dehydrogenase